MTITDYTTRDAGTKEGHNTIETCPRCGRNGMMLSRERQSTITHRYVHVRATIPEGGLNFVHTLDACVLTDLPK